MQQQNSVATPTVRHVKVKFAAAPNTENMDVTLQAFEITSVFIKTLKTGLIHIYFVCQTGE